MTRSEVQQNAEFALFRIRQLHTPGLYCGHPETRHCVECSRLADGQHIPHPCPTLLSFADLLCGERIDEGRAPCFRPRGHEPAHNGGDGNSWWPADPEEAPTDLEPAL